MGWGRRPALRGAGARPEDAVDSLREHWNIPAQFGEKGRPSPGARHSLKCRYGRIGVPLKSEGQTGPWPGQGRPSDPAAGLGRLVGTSACQRRAPPASECAEDKTTASPDSVCGEVMLQSTTWVRRCHGPRSKGHRRSIHLRGSFARWKRKSTRRGECQEVYKVRRWCVLFSGPHHLTGSRRCEVAWREAWVRFRRTREGGR